jgi:hypothetical protein
VFLGAVAAVLGAYLALLSFAAFFHPDGVRAVAPVSRIAVLVPAHDEAALIARCVTSLRAQEYPAELFDVIVVADNCTDDTAALARSAGADVLVRDAPDLRGKGRALRWAMDRLLASRAPDAIVVVDADTVADPGFLATLVAPFEAGAPVVQGESLIAEDGTARTALRAAAFLLINRVRPSGRAVLGLPCRLCGNGMLVSSRVLAERPWNAFSAAEDLEYSVVLRSAGIAPVFARGAILLSPAAPTAAAAVQQQLRWEGGRRHVVRTWGPRLVARAVRERSPSLLDIAADAAIPPVGVFAAGVAAGLGATTTLVLAGVLPAVTLAPWVAAAASIPTFVVVGLRAAGAPASSYRALTGAPALVAGKVLGLRRVRRFRADTWVRTER